MMASRTVGQSISLEEMDWTAIRIITFSAGSLAANTLLGGVASVAAGGKFANGAVTAAFGYLFNASAKELAAWAGHDQDRLTEHFLDHGRDFKAVNDGNYIMKSQEFLSRPADQRMKMRYDVDEGV